MKTGGFELRLFVHETTFCLFEMSPAFERMVERSSFCEFHARFSHKIIELNVNLFLPVLVSNFSIVRRAIAFIVARGRKCTTRRCCGSNNVSTISIHIFRRNVRLYVYFCRNFFIKRLHLYKPAFACFFFFFFNFFS